jgi:hypothetical protein
VVGVGVCLEESWDSADREQHPGGGEIVAGSPVQRSAKSMMPARLPTGCDDVGGVQVYVEPQWRPVPGGSRYGLVPDVPDAGGIDGPASPLTIRASA